MEFLPIPEPIFNLDEWFKTTFKFDGNGNFINEYSNKKYYYQFDSIIKKIGNSQTSNILNYLKNIMIDSRITFDNAAHVYEFHKTTSNNERLGFSVLEYDFNKFSSRGTWHEQLKKYRNDDKHLHLAWENECLRKKVQELDNTMKIIINMGLINDNSSKIITETETEPKSEPEKEMICFCKKVVIKRCVETNTPNKGKYYLSCATRSCGFFTWCPYNFKN